MDGAERMTCLVGEDLPFGRGFDDDICGGDGLASIGLRSGLTYLAEPCQPNSSTCVAGRQQSPICVVVVGKPTPGGKQVQALGNIDVGTALGVPRSRAWWGRRTVFIGDGQVLDAQGNVEGTLVQD